MNTYLNALLRLLRSLFRPPYSHLVLFGLAFLLLAILMKVLQGSLKLTSRTAHAGFDILFLYSFGFLTYGQNQTLSSLIRGIPFWEELAENSPIKDLPAKQLIPFSCELVKMVLLAMLAGIVTSFVEKKIREAKILPAFGTWLLWKVIVVVLGLATCLAVDYLFAHYLKGSRLQWAPFLLLLLLSALMLLLLLKLLGLAAVLTASVAGFFTGHVIGHALSAAFAASLCSTLLLIVAQLRGITGSLASGSMTLAASWPALLVVMLLGFIVEKYL